jgi:hypothetical protein
MSTLEHLGWLLTAMTMLLLSLAERRRMRRRLISERLRR